MTRSQKPTRHWGRNFLAMLIAGTAIGVAHIHNDPMSIGGNPVARADTFSVATMSPMDTTPIQAPLETVEGQEQVPENPDVLRGIWAVKMVHDMLVRGVKQFQEVPDYTATMFKQERVGGTLTDGQQIEMKIKHEPFSVYMKWLSGDRGRQLIYVDGENDGNFLVQPGGIKGRLTGVIALDPNGSLALSESRHPVTNIGLLELAKLILQYQERDLERGEGFKAEIHDNQQYEGRDCYLVRCEYDSPEINSEYRKSVFFIDKELSLPVCVKNYTWVRDADPEKLDEESLIEFYAYTNIEFSQELTTADFDATNRKYRLRVRR